MNLGQPEQDCPNEVLRILLPHCRVALHRHRDVGLAFAVEPMAAGAHVEIDPPPCRLRFRRNRLRRYRQCRARRVGGQRTALR